jgi:hypothetical protein
MKLSPHLIPFCVKALVESMSVEMMVTFTRKLIHNYDIHRQTGFPESISVPKRDAAAQILRDIRENQLVVPFVNILVDTHINGHMGRPYPIANIREILREVHSMGYIYDQEYKMFVENPNVQRTRNWGVLREGEEHAFTILRLDIVGNSTLVRENSDDLIQEAYAGLRWIVQEAVDRRNGRIWSWEGDGGLAAFYFSNKNMFALLAGMEIIHELFLFNKIQCRLNKPLSARVAIHSGPCLYTSNMEELKKLDTIKKIGDIEANFTKPNTMTISNTSSQHFDEPLLTKMRVIDAGPNLRYYNYAIQWED